MVRSKINKSRRRARAAKSRLPGLSLVERTARLLAVGRREKVSDNHRAEAAKLLRPLSEVKLSELVGQGVSETVNQAASTASAVSPASTSVVTTVAKPTITVIEFADAVRVHVDGKLFRTYDSSTGWTIETLLKHIAEETQAIDVASVVLTHLSS